MSGKKEYVPARGDRRLFHLRYQGREALRRHGHGVHVAAHLHVDGNRGLLFIVKHAPFHGRFFLCGGMVRPNIRTIHLFFLACL